MKRLACFTSEVCRCKIPYRHMLSPRLVLYSIVAMKKAALCVIFLIFASHLMPGATGYLQHNLVADVPGVADITDPNLVNAWGIAISTASPFWVCDGGTGLSTVYTASATTFAVSATKAIIPPSSTGGNTVCTGIVNNSTTSFPIGPAPGRPASFIFATEGGTISGWANAVDATHAQMAVDNSSSGAVYKGLAIVTTPAPQLYAANFHSGAIDVFDGNFKPVTLAAGAFTDPMIPAGFAPFNIQNLGGKLYVTYAKQDAAKIFDAPGVGNGYVDVYDTTGKLLQHLASQGPLNSPWGVQIAPATFGKFAGALIVGNFGDGLVDAFDANTGALLGTLQDQNGKNLQIQGLWGLQFGNGGNGGDPNVLYFTAGPSAQKHGIFGLIEANPVVTSSSFANAGTTGAGIAPNTFVAIYGAGLSATTRQWQTADFAGNKLPVSLDGVTVTINGQPAYLSFISPKQINLLTPADMPAGGQVQIAISNNGLTSAPAAVQTNVFGPAFFLLGGKYAAAQHGNYTVIGPTTLVPNNSTPAKPGETVVIYGTGFGTTNPAIPSGQLVTSPAQLTTPPIIMIGGVPAIVTFAGLTGTGLYQFNVMIPDATPDGDNLVTASIGGFTSPGGVFIAVQH